MGQEHPEISEKLADFIRAQHLFFVATAPAGPGGHVNVSPKGRDTLVILGARRVAYLDLTGSGIETIAHLRENGRITFMFCSFEGKSKIVRLHGRGTAHPIGSAAFDDLAAHFPEMPGRRAVIDVEIDRVSTSCGFGVPRMQLVAERDEIAQWVERKGGEPAMEGYRHRKNATSIDGLAGWSSPPAGS
ncbi:MAG: pyridoxamine 5'-phosphate oxidase family protein [Acidimicrobiia bacterium]|nr:pyridoxamine 5'-phosphate oxidase family protein [Acidimicrobiia bacterium]